MPIQRAAVIIGIHKTGNLPALADAVGGARQVERWALAQGMARDHVIVHTDEAGPVDLYHVKNTIKQLIERGTVEQLIVYFAGHGVNMHRGEYWLLSDAPSDPQAAVNVEGSVALARGNGIPHVVLISDACRTAPEGIQAGSVTGGEVFRNDVPNGPEAHVDLFFAATLGMPSLEVRNPADASSAYKAVYTRALVDALDGVDAAPSLIQPDAAAVGFGLIRPWPLYDHLLTEVPRRIRRQGLPLHVNQTPDARITSRPDAWLSRIALPDPGPRMRGLNPPPPPPPPPPPSSPGAPSATGAASTRPATLQDVTAQVVTAALRQPGGADTLVADLVAGQAAGAERAPQVAVPMAAVVAEFARDVTLSATEFGPPHFESECGFKVRGAAVVEAHSTGADIQVFGPQILRVTVRQNHPAASVQLILDDGTSVVVPAIREFVGALTFDADGGLRDVAYEPSDNTGRWRAYERELSEIRSLRAVIASAARYGAFRLDDANAAGLARRMQLGKGIDPSLAIYAAYAYHDLQRHDRIKEMRDYLHGDLGLRLFDIDMLARTPSGSAAGDEPDRFPFVPLLAQGWALLDAYRVRLPNGLADLRRHLLPSLWTQFDAAGTVSVRDAIATGRVR